MSVLEGDVFRPAHFVLHRIRSKCDIRMRRQEDNQNDEEYKDAESWQVSS